MPMKLTEFFLEQLEREGEITRHTLERVPEAQNEWQPDSHSMALGRLASLVATMPGWIASMVRDSEFDMSSAEGKEFRPAEWRTRGELLSALDRSLQQAREALQTTKDEHLLAPWKFRVGGHVVSEDPRHVMIQDTVFNHLAHHRGQLTVYLQLNKEKDSAGYTRSADEGRIS